MEGGTLLVRLNKYLSMCGVTSRRKADQLIKEGRVKVNGLVVRELGYKIDPHRDTVEVDGKVLKPPRKRYIALYKPCCYLTAIGRGVGDKKPLDELLKGIPERVFPAGRLDYNAEGLLILTNDGELANRILHPRYKLPKVYKVLVRGKVEQATLKRMLEGAQLLDGFAKPQDVKFLRYEGENTWLQITFTIGRKHIVKRYCAHFGHKVLRLIRIAIGPIRLGKLSPGKWRDLTLQEVTELKKAVGMLN